MNKRVPSQFKTAINPQDVFVAKSAPAFMAMMDTLGKCEHELAGTHFVLASQGAGHWVGLVYEDKADLNTDFANMVELGYLSEIQVEGGWLYALTQFAVEQIYVRQTKRAINHLKLGVRLAHGQTFLGRLRKIFTPAPLMLV